MATYVIEMDEEEYRIAGPGGEVGDVVPYGEMATLRIGQWMYAVLVDDPNTESPPAIERFERRDTVDTEHEDVAFDDEDEEDDEEDDDDGDGDDDDDDGLEEDDPDHDADPEEEEYEEDAGDADGLPMTGTEVPVETGESGDESELGTGDVGDVGEHDHGVMEVVM